MKAVKVVTLLCLLGLTVTLDKFENKLEFMQCVRTCEKSISKCLEDIDSACHKAYTQCHDAENFIECIGSANGLQMQEIHVCMKEKCTAYKEPTEEEKHGSGKVQPVKNYKKVKEEAENPHHAPEPEEEDNAPEVDLQATPKPKKTIGNKDKNRRR